MHYSQVQEFFFYHSIRTPELFKDLMHQLWNKTGILDASYFFSVKTGFEHLLHYMWIQKVWLSASVKALGTRSIIQCVDIISIETGRQSSSSPFSK